MKRSIRVAAAALLPLLALALLFRCGTKPVPVVEDTTEDPYWSYAPQDEDPWDPWTTTEPEETEPEETEPEETDPPVAPVVNTTRQTTTSRRTTTTTKRTTTTTKATTTTTKPTTKPTTTSSPFTTIPSGGTGGTTTTKPGDTTTTRAGTTTTTKPTTTTTGAPVKVTGVGFSGATAFTLQAGRTQQLTWAVTPSTATNKGVVFSTSNRAVATVSPNGLVTGVGEGTAVITITTTDPLADLNFTDTATVTVAPVYASSINIYAPSSPTVVKVGSTVTLTARVNEGGTPPTTPGVTWTSSDTSIAMVSASTGVVTGVFPGTVIITATSNDGRAAKTTSITVNP